MEKFLLLLLMFQSLNATEENWPYVWNKYRHLF